MRILLFIIALVSLFQFPWLAIACGILLAVRYPSWELLILAFVADLTWMPGPVFAHLPIFTMLVIIVLWSMEFLRNEFLLR